MSLIQQIEEDYKAAFKSHNEVRTSTLRLLKSSIKNAEIEARHELTDEEIIAVMTKEAKRRRESIAMYEQAGRSDLVARENAELQELMLYLPTQMSDSEISDLAKTVIAELQATAKDFGKVMSTVIARSKGQADGQRVSVAVKALLQ